MPSDVRLAPVRQPRRARYLVPLATPRRGEVLAAAAVAAVLAGVLFAPLTLILAVAFDAVSRASRWRPLWLSVPAGWGAVWVLVIGPAAAVAGLRRGPVAVGLSRGMAAPARLPGLVAVGLPGQLPLALILAAAAAAAAWWLRWLHTDEWDLPRARPGLLRAWHRRRATSSLRAGRLLTRDGACLGVDEASGRAAALSWRDAGGGVLVTGAAAPAVLASGLHLAHAAIRRRRPVIVVDLTGDRELPAALAAICAAARAPLHLFGEAGGPRYEPRLRPGPEQQAALAAVPWGPRGGTAAVTGASLADVVRQRAVALFALGRAGSDDAAAVLAGLLAADTAALYAGLYRGGIAPDGLCWLTECGGTDPAALAGLIAAGSPTGLAPVLATTVAGPAARIAGQVNAVIVHRLADPGLASELAPLTGTTFVPLSRVLARPGYGPVTETRTWGPGGRLAAPERQGSDGADGVPATGAQASHAVPLGTVAVPVVQAGTLCTLGSSDFVLVTGLATARAGGAAATVRARCAAFSGRIGRPPEPSPGPPVSRRPA